MSTEKCVKTKAVGNCGRNAVLEWISSARIVLFGLSLVTVVALLSPIGICKVVIWSPSLAQMPGLRGEAAITHLRQNGMINSLADAVEASSYEATAEGAAVTARNGANGLEMNFTSTGLQLKSAMDKDKWVSNWRLRSLGYGDAQAPVPSGKLTATSQRIELDRDEQQLKEWYENSPNGVEHGFTLEARPGMSERGEALRLVMTLDGDLTARSDENGQALTLLKSNGEEALRYDKLKVWDALGQDLTARMVSKGGDLFYEIDDAQAEYPITIDPTFSSLQKIEAGDGVAGDQFGGSVAISGNTAIIGANANAGAVAGTGFASVYVRNGSSWTLQQKLTASDGAVEDAFGSAVAIAGDTVVIGAFSDAIGTNQSQGSAYVFVRSGTTWTQQQKLTASDGASFDIFGRSVAIAGESVVVGAASSNVDTNVDQGAAYVFVRSGATWTEQRKLTAADGSASDFFGDSVAIAGDTVIVGATEDNGGANTQQGSAYVFVRSGDTWSQEQKLTAGDGTAFDYFGFSVAVSGNTAVVGTLQDIGTNFQQGSAYVFVRSGSTWTQQQKLLADDGAAGDSFGNSVTVLGDTVMLGAAGDTNGANARQGSAYIFTRSGTTWTQQQKLTATDGGAEDSFGASVAITTDAAIIGSLGDTIGANTFQGSAYVFAPSVTVSGTVKTPSGLNLRNAVVTMTDALGVKRTATTSTFGVYSFDNVSPGDTYLFTVASKRYRFSPQSLLITDNVSNVNFTGLE